MNVKRIIVDEVPESCNDCDFLSSKFINNYSVCNLRNERIPEIFIENPGIPDWCPLVVDECCEWVKEEFEMYISPHNNGDWSEKDDYKFCPSCGKRIKYVEVE